MKHETSTNVKHLPIPYFEIDEELNILAHSDKSVETFNKQTNFLDLVDLESKEKALIFLVSTPLQEEIELVLQTANSPYSLFNCSIHWNKGVGYLVCIEQTEKTKELENKVEKLCKRLAETNFELLEQKEQLEDSFKRILELSANFIKLSDSVGLVPLTGELNPELIDENHLSLTTTAHEGNYTIMFFDFSGVGNLTAEGVKSFSQLIQSLNVVGVICYVIGMKPDHAVYLKNKNINKNTYFMRNLDEIVQIDLEYTPQKHSIVLH